ncbi:very long-chain specific acyl-CoA dehydrogenase, mitochondrial [Microplitis demolitor]|uniref:very long-chain specific acyl-CoA dehydrogenase, mitochondrial n=1 Tax=Microplitis demolitor TaxID=69319 RepID=UPI0004CD1711|nr:very long-chain specific acyl-CoA dehydrogenase, mitochondrial [Microplitis demolitor]XP_008552139.1 very long-chain specific acyl-CoA dehydrogenase, mitochondrial [Microplitis demolitor]
MLNVSRIISQAPKQFHKFVQLNTRCLATQAASKLEKPETKEKKESQSFTMNMFRGQLQLDQVIPFPKPLSQDQSETLKMLIDPFSNFFMEVNDPVKNDDTAKVDEKTLQVLWELGAFAIQIPEQYGGIGLNNTQYGRLVEIVGQNDLGLGIVLGAHQSIGFKGILLYGTPEQKEKYLTRVSNGEYAAFALTEPSLGSDASAVKTRAVKSADGTHYVMNGSKIWISNGGIANIFTVFAKVPIKDPITGETSEKMTAFIVDRNFGGVTSGPPENKMGIKCSNTAEVYFEDVKVPAENVLVGEGQGFKVAMNILNNGRFGMAAALSGTMQACIKKAVEHANQRVQFGKTINQFGAIQEKIARMSMLQYVTQSLAYMVSGNMDLGSQEYQLEAAISKVFASESAWFVCDEAIQILGGMGYMKSTGLERVMRDIRIFRIFEGTNDILRLFIALTGIQYAGGHLQELQKAFKNPAANLGLIFEEAAKRATKAVGLGSTPNFAHLLHPSLAESANLTGKSIESFGQTVEGLLIKYGRGIVNEQFVLNRLAQAAIDTYTSVVVLSRASKSLNDKIPSAEHESIMAKVWCTEAASRTAYNLKVVKSDKYLDTFNKLKHISRNVCESGECAQNTPLGF